MYLSLKKICQLFTVMCVREGEKRKRHLLKDGQNSTSIIHILLFKILEQFFRMNSPYLGKWFTLTVCRYIKINYRNSFYTNCAFKNQIIPTLLISLCFSSDSRYFKDNCVWKIKMNHQRSMRAHYKRILFLSGSRCTSSPHNKREKQSALLLTQRIRHDKRDQLVS